MRRSAYASLFPYKTQVFLLFTLLLALIVVAFVVYGIVNFIAKLNHGDPIALALLVSGIGIFFVLTNKLGLILGYKEQIA